MITTTTTTRSHRGRRVAAAVLVGLGLVSLGVASASHLTVEAEGDLVASGVDVDVEGFLGPDATADVKVTYADVNGGTEAATLATEPTLPPTVTLTIDPKTATVPVGSKYQVYFYKGSDTTPVTSATVTTTAVDECVETPCTLDVTLVANALPAYDRVAVVAVSSSYPTPTP
ncbi:hypothetical protein Xcel_2835 [Xylanimonas cellulosilytica DSM 15894]|uniref:Uncharacterized protein n=1 Tax=Xylanimonas cellulosilytica (strain DSM 15894 / JCM 12276 / CECT 5975 / KCTC 9989 / LMG 20990 / NBRC 107835 / XIL07) TaxID=446471 RepID=D1BYH7_XYLCX|nr:hypothetical protein [Xylanimonas cellulosilytica]ACZ31849.1 hypothetical protein Xcel_2835 [Xylanimonas cellulosilytica DSM 15894]